MHTSLPTVGVLLRDWRQRRRLSQLDLALEANVSARHLSFIETGRSNPSPQMVLQLSERLEIPFRERNRMLLAAGYAPAFDEYSLDAPELGPVRDAIDRVLEGHEPYPALVVDRHWGMVTANSAVGLLLEGVAVSLLEPPMNVLRLSLHPEGLAPRIANLGEWRGHLLERLGRQAVVTGDPALAALHEELAGYSGGDGVLAEDPAAAEIAAPLRLRAGGRLLSFVSTVTTFGTATEITASELSIEAFFPADAETAQALQVMASASAP